MGPVTWRRKFSQIKALLIVPVLVTLAATILSVWTMTPYTTAEKIPLLSQSSLCLEIIAVRLHLRSHERHDSQERNLTSH